MNKLENSYYLVRGHLGEDYFEKVTDDPNQVDSIQETCNQCGDNDCIEGDFSTYEEGLKLIKAQGYNPEYRETMERRLYRLE
ncbi:hypothetical protein [uncultured Limosilactobacillus sp.]|uniref:hypothetical protein n=1 Tax=uncultured Limosilactobacillus sp. TaxID=2837629 RepID=UPI0025DED985|nr:hypothetical protein [uncultured Limosilactobacillus sp.]